MAPSERPLPCVTALQVAAFSLRPLGELAARGRECPAYDLWLRHPVQGGLVWRLGRQQALDWAAQQGEAVLNATLRKMAACEEICPPFAGLEMDRLRVMGIVNATPDSFSDGGHHYHPHDAVAAGVRMLEAGADVLDIGGESTRPGSDEVDPAEEIRRVEPVIRELANRGALISIDTRHAAVMEAAVAAGAAIVNDVTALAGDPNSLAVVARLDVPVVLMHIRGEPKTMQFNPRYHWAPLDVYDELHHRLVVCLDAGLRRENLCIDPGIGFGKTVEHNLQILEALSLYHGMGVPVLLGASRKSFIAQASRGETPQNRLPGSLAAVCLAARSGTQIVRVHDVAETKQALAVIPQ